MVNKEFRKVEALTPLGLSHPPFEVKSFSISLMAIFLSNYE
jgi:hypothetical protein